jgi:hypothetical protein
LCRDTKEVGTNPKDNLEKEPNSNGTAMKRVKAYMACSRNMRG